MPKITELKPSECFVFGANTSGFHGAGSAGSAFSGNSANTWRTNPEFQKALTELNKKNAGKPHDSEALKGKWAVLGETELMQGKEGMSYGIVTTEAPGRQGKVNDTFLLKEMCNLITCAKENPKLEFLCVNFGLSRAHGGFSWWSPKELRKLWEKAQETTGPIPTNLKAPEWASPKKEIPSPDPGPELV